MSRPPRTKREYLCQLVEGKKKAFRPLTDEEKAQFEEVYSSFLKKGGMLMYTRKKIGAKNISFFELQEAQKKVIDAPRKNLLSEML